MLKRKIRILAGKKDDTKNSAETKRHEETSPAPVSEKEKLPQENELLHSHQLNGIAMKRLMREYDNCHQISQRTDPAFSVELIESSLVEWNIKLYHIDKESKLFKDMKRFNINHILLRATFPNDFPFAPPFLRVVFPRICNGYVLAGGAICMELLTREGWSSVYTVEAMIMQFSSQVVKGNGRIQEQWSEPYSKKDAENSFKKLSKLHEVRGWYTPPASEG